MLGGRESVLQRMGGRRMSSLLQTRKKNARLDRFPYILLHGRVHGQRSRGHPRKIWMGNVREDYIYERAGLTLTQAVREAHDRVKWRFIWMRSMRASASPGH